MKEYKIPCAWQVYGYLRIGANSVKEAIEQAESTDTPLPDHGEYLEGSFKVDRQGVVQFHDGR